MTDDSGRRPDSNRLDINNYHPDRVERFDGLRQGRWTRFWREWLAGKQYWLAIVLISGLAMVVAIEMLTNIDLGFVPNDPQQGEPAPRP